MGINIQNNIMLENVWDPSCSAAEKLGIKEVELSILREKGIFKPGIHWKSCPSGQVKPWSPEVYMACPDPLRTIP